MRTDPLTETRLAGAVQGLQQVSEIVSGIPGTSAAQRGELDRALRILATTRETIRRTLGAIDPRDAGEGQ